MIQVVHQGLYWTKGAVFFGSTIVVNAGMITGDTLWEPPFCSWFLTLKSDNGKIATFSHWPKLNTLFATQVWILLWSLLEAKANRKAVLKVRCLRSVFHRLKVCLCELI